MAADPRTDTPADPLAFAQLLINLLDEGRRAATYKLAVVLGLVDCCLANADNAGHAPSEIATRELARAVIAIYWPQVRLFPVGDEHDVVLRQSSLGKAVAVVAVREFRELGEAAGARSFPQAELLVPEALDNCVDVVELSLARMPLGKLQRPGTYTDAQDDYPRFLYDDRSFHEGITRSMLDRQPMPIQLGPRVGDWLVSLNGLIRPLLELHWTRAVARYNAQVVGQDRLRDFLFGATRIGLHPIVAGLRRMQDDRCFYCAAGLGKAVDVDHFIPWSRMPNDALANLVLADRRCNSSKRDRLASISLLMEWAKRPRSALQDIASETRWPLGALESRRIARGIYSRVTPKSQLWAGPSMVALADASDLGQALEALAE